VGISFYAIYEFTGKYIGEGYVDLPVASLSFVVVYSLLMARDIKDWQALKENLILGSLSSAAAAVTKQPGLYLLAAYPFLAYFIVLKDFDKVLVKEKIQTLAKNFLVALLIAVPWYVYTVIQIRNGEYTSNIQFVTTDIYDGQSLLDRFTTAWIALGGYAYLYLFLLLSLPVMDKAYRWIILTIIVPYSVLWGFFLSYEYRNLAIAFPLVGIAAGVGIQKVLEKFKFSSLRKWLGPVILIGALIWSANSFNGDYLLKMQNERQREIFQPEINNKLYTYFANHDGPGVVLSPYPVGWLPGLKEYWVLDRFSDYAEYQKKLEEKTEIEYLLIFESADVKIYKEVFDKVADGEFEQIFVEGTYTFVKLNP
jgi:hypothetical protein